MKWYQRIYWKIFLVIWSVSTFLLVLTVLMLGSLSEKQRFQELVVARAEGYADLIIERYERRGLKPFPGRISNANANTPDPAFIPAIRPMDGFRYYFDRAYGDQVLRRAMLLNIRDRVRIQDIQTQQRVSGFTSAAFSNKPSHAFVTHSSSGRNYHVRVNIDWEGSPLLYALNTLLSVQIVLVMLVSVIAAALVSTIILRPVKALIEHTRAIASGELSRRPGGGLTRRGDELGELAREFDRMAETIDHTVSDQRRLLQDVSHELRSPLARLQTATGLIERKLDGKLPDGNRHIARITHECEQLDSLIGELLNLSRIDHLNPTQEIHKLSVILQKTIDDVQYAHPDYPIQANLIDKWQCKIRPELLQRALHNVLLNACIHTPPQTPVYISLQPDAQWIHIHVRDHGPGVAEPALPKLSKPFYRQSHQSGGHGLGLSIARKAMHHLGGELQIENADGGGLLVSLSLPMEICELDTPPNP